MDDDHFVGKASNRAREFVVELEALCESYGFTLSTTMYEGLQIWPRSTSDKSPLHVDGIEDRTQDALPRPPGDRDWSDPALDEDRDDGEIDALGATARKE